MGQHKGTFNFCVYGLCCLTELESSVIVFKLIIINEFVVLLATKKVNTQIESDALRISLFLNQQNFNFLSYRLSNLTW